MNQNFVKDDLVWSYPDPEPKQCPACAVTWEEEETIYEYFLAQGNDEVEARRIAEMFGCVPDNPKHFGANVMGIEVREYDGITYWKCLACEVTFNRWDLKPADKQFKP